MINPNWCIISVNILTGWLDIEPTITIETRIFIYYQINVTIVTLVTIYHIRLHTVYFKLSVYVHIISIIWYLDIICINRTHVPTTPVPHNTCEISCPPHLLSPYYTGCNRRKGPNFGRVFLMLNYTEKTQNTYIQSW